MKVIRSPFRAADLRDGHANAWDSVDEATLVLSPSPIAMTEPVSPYMAITTGHGSIKRLSVQMAHDDTILSLRLSWPDPDRDDDPADLDQFVDAVSVMFPLAPGASAYTMGSHDKPVNAWLWRADESTPLDVLAEGYATSRRRPGEMSRLTVNSYHDNDTWVVVFQRPMKIDGEAFVSIEAGGELGIAFAVWEGSNRERSAAKAVSGEFTNVSVDV